ncbi:hypothetical protein, partial [Corallococcus praedator]|uniref:hypothetical protein n=1 Tax=Corallococcus praedator TaxID=2316724 RepID=UPI001ABFA237
PSSRTRTSTYITFDRCRPESPRAPARTLLLADTDARLPVADRARHRPIAAPAFDGLGDTGTAPAGGAARTQTPAADGDVFRRCPRTGPPGPNPGFLGIGDGTAGALDSGSISAGAGPAERLLGSEPGPV